jgi:hypothetical protein
VSALINVHFVRLGTFDRTAKGLLSDEDERAIEADIADDPEAAPVISGTGGVRKIRGRLGQRGKRGGVRVLYVYDAAGETVYLLLAYAKNVREDISNAEKKEIKTMVERLWRNPRENQE